MALIKLMYLGYLNAFIVVLMLAGLAFIIGPFFITLIAGAKYKSAGEIIGWLCLGQAFGGMYLMVTNYIFYAKKTGRLALLTISTGLINLGLLFIMVSQFGLVGAAMSFAIAKLIQFLMTFLISSNVCKMPWKINLYDTFRR